MGKRIRKIKNIRIHREGTNTLAYTAIGMALVGVLFWYVFDIGIVFDVLVCLMAVVYGVMVNFFRCPIRYFNGDDTEGIVVAPADGKVVVIEEVEEDTYFHDRRMMVSIFMSLFNVHANWFPVDGKVKFVKHHDGNFHKAWLPKASEENERADVLIETEDGEEVLCRQVAGAVARRIDEHLGFIKFGSRVDVFLPLGSKVCVKMGQSTTGDQTVIAMLPAKH